MRADRGVGGAEVGCGGDGEVVAFYGGAWERGGVEGCGGVGGAVGDEEVGDGWNC